MLHKKYKMNKIFKIFFYLLILSSCKKEELNDVTKNLSNCEIDCLLFNGNIYSANNNLEYIDNNLLCGL